MLGTKRLGFTPAGMHMTTPGSSPPPPSPPGAAATTIAASPPPVDNSVYSILTWLYAAADVFGYSHPTPPTGPGSASLAGVQQSDAALAAQILQRLVSDGAFKALPNITAFLANPTPAKLDSSTVEVFRQVALAAGPLDVQMEANAAAARKKAITWGIAAGAGGLALGALTMWLVKR